MQRELLRSGKSFLRCLACPLSIYSYLQLWCKIQVPLIVPTLPSTFLKIFYLFLERGERRERNINQLPLVCTPTRDRAHSPDLCPDWNSNPQPFSLWDEPSLTGQGPAKQFGLTFHPLFHFPFPFLKADAKPRR